jgi:C-terminal processing protease CtpA/Prc
MSGMNLKIAATLLAIGGLYGCGGSDSQNNPTNGNGGDVTLPLTWTFDVFKPESEFENYCVSPRTGIDPYTSTVYPDKAGSAMHEKMWLRSWNNRTYLWYREVADVNPQDIDILKYFERLKTTAVTDSGASKDNYHFYRNTAEYKQETQAGISFDYGINWKVTNNRPPRKFEVAYLEPASPALNAGIVRGDLLLQIDGVDFVNDNSEFGVQKLIEGLAPTAVGKTHTFKFRSVIGIEKTVTMSSASVVSTPVMNVQILNAGTKKVGYLQFNSHIANAQPQLINAVQQFKDGAVNELVVDLRYNGGGLLALASQFAYMVSGPNIIQNRFFEQMVFNDKYPSTDPITGNSLTPTGFYSRGIDYNAGIFTNQTLPNLNLSKVIVLTTDDTCSASEAFINGLRGVDMEIIQIGGKTCGKPYGFYPKDNCGTTYFTIQFKGVNAKGFGEFADGFEPKPSPTFAADVKGCAVVDDLTKPLGNTEEALLKTALHYVSNNSCPITLASSAAEKSRSGQASIIGTTDGIAIPNPRDQRKLMENKIYLPIRDN